MKACNFMWPSTSPRFTITTPYPQPHLRLRTYTSRAAPFFHVKAFQRGDFDRFADDVKSEFGISPRVRSFSADLSRNFPKYRKQFSAFLNTPLGGSFATIFFLWFALSGWLFRVIIIATWVLPIAGPLLIGAVANNFVIKGECPACKRQFIGYKSQIIRCEGCGNIVWQPQGDFFSKDGNNNNNSKGNSKKPPKSQIIDVDFEEK
ncbi:PREDICTED: uncharacterized protein LOC104704600 [Camelina sativa]|uniref:Uncharacterized protein LOC104704600 n=1 Tax=Camelina sativa TaxID=90675 RepID=A0ABM1Q764_CAMSA|nr:PREDICTED: uncharacterized protein LOC104704600 [Camelina sativa]